jgi:prepilin-type N-terminal cleavage/methylation domain-containing protein
MVLPLLKRQFVLVLKRPKIKMHHGFTLIEVIITAFIVSFTGIAVMNMSLANTKIDKHISDKSDLGGFISIISFHHNEQFDKFSRPLLDFLDADDSYRIEHDGLRAYLENTEIDYSEEVENAFTFAPPGVSEDAPLEDNPLVQNPDDLEDQLPEIEIRKAQIKYKDISSHIYFLYQTEQSITQQNQAFGNEAE